MDEANENQSIIELEELAKKLKIKEPKDWGRITTRKVIENGGIHVLRAYQGSLYKALESVFPGSYLISPLSHM